MPAIAAAASWMEALHMPMREIKKRYTKSELVIMAWRSQESAYNMRKKTARTTASNKSSKSETPKDYYDHVARRAHRLKKDDAGYNHFSDATPAQADDGFEYGPDDTGLEQRLGPVADKLDESLNLRKLTGKEAQRYMHALGIPVPIFNPMHSKK